MAAYTTSVSPVGVNPGGPSIFRAIGSKIKDAKEQAVEARQEADQRIEQGSERIKELEANIATAAAEKKDVDPKDLEELAMLKQDVSSLKEKRSEKAYFFKKALKFQATDRIKTTIGKFQRDPALENDPAASEKERFYAKAGLFRPDQMPDVSGREENNKDIVSYVGKGFQLIMDAVDKIKGRINRTATTTEKTASTANATQSTTEGVKNSSEDFTNNTESISNVSKEELKIQKQELDLATKAETDNEKRAAEAAAEMQNLGGEEGINVAEVGLSPFSFLGKGIDAVKEKVRFAREIAGRVAGRGRGAGGVRGVRLGGRTSGIQPKTAYTAPIGPQPMNSSTPWASRGAGERGGMFGQDGYVPRLPSQSLSKGGIISRPKAKKSSDSVSSAPTLLTSPTNISGMGGTKKLASGGIVTPPAAKASDISPSTAVLPTDRGAGKKLIQGKKSDTENISKLFQLGPMIFGGIGFSAIAQLAQVPFLGALMKAAKPMIAPVIKAFGLPESTINLLFGSQKPAGSTVAGDPGAGGQPPGGGDNPPPPPPTGGPLQVGPSMTATGGDLPSRNIFSRFGLRTSPGGVGSTNHQGIDISGGQFQQGAAVSVIKPGVVVHTEDLGRSGWGKYVVIKHDDGTHTLYGHLSEINVRTGDKIENKSGAAKVIGKIGSTGVSTGPHLHFELGNGWDGGNITNKVNPEPYIDSYVRGGGNVKVDAIPVTARPTATPTAAAPAGMPNLFGSTAGGLSGPMGLTLPSATPGSPFVQNPLSIGNLSDPYNLGLNFGGAWPGVR